MANPYGKTLPIDDSPQLFNISANLKDKIVFQKNQQYALLESRTL